MKTDHWFYGVFRDLPWLVFRFMELPDDRAAGYEFDAAELKAVSLRLDGIFRPKAAGEPYFFVKAQLYKDPEFYRKWLAKISLYTLQYHIEADWRGLVLFGNRGHEPDVRYGIEEWIDSGRIQRVFLEELPEYPGVSLEVALLKLAVAGRENLQAKARDLVVAVKAADASVKNPKKLLEFIETIVVSNFPQLTRAEIQTMLQLHDIRESTIFLEGKLEGQQEERMAMIVRLHLKGLSHQEICDYLGVDGETVRAALAPRRDS